MSAGHPCLVAVNEAKKQPLLQSNGVGGRSVQFRYRSLAPRWLSRGGSCRRGDLNSPPPPRIQHRPAVASAPERHLATGHSAPYRSIPLQGARCH